MGLHADMCRWTGNPSRLKAYSGVTSAEQLASAYGRSPFIPAEPGGTLTRQELYRKCVHRRLGGVFPGDDLWPAGNCYRPYAMYPLQPLLRQKRPGNNREAR
jgi:hypothetical protein